MAKSNQLDKKNEKGNAPEKEFLPPDGGWGWMIVLGSALSNIVLIPIVQNFGLIFMDRFNELGFTPTDVTSLMSLNSSFGMILGIFNAPLLKKYGYRKVALAGVTMFTSGIFITAYASSYTHFLISYGMLASIGMMVTMASFSLAMNTYFRKNRSKASGFTMTLTGIGPIVMPLLVSLLLTSYGVKWTAILLAAINMHAFVGALLLQPVSWHTKKPELEKMTEAEDENEDEEKPIQIPDSNSLFGHDSSISGSRSNLVPRLGRSVSAVYSGSWQSQDAFPKMKNTKSQELLKHNYSEVDTSVDNRRERSVTCLDNEDYGDMMRSMLYLLEKPEIKSKPPVCGSVESLNYERDDKFSDRNSLIKGIPFEVDRRLVSVSESDEKRLENGENEEFIPNGTIQNPKKAEEDDDNNENKKSSCCSKFFNLIRRLYDLDLLADPIYINLMIGMSIAIIGELIFSLLTPFILEELGLNLDQKATFMSVVAITDLVCRFLSPYLGKILKFGSRKMYVLALFLLLLTRASLFLASSYVGLLVVAAGLGIGKGVRTVFWVLVIPDYVPLAKLPSASAFQSLANGLLLLLSGPLIGAVVAISNSYMSIIYTSNLLTFTTILMWSVEFIIVRCRAKKKLNENPEPSV